MRSYIYYFLLLTAILAACGKDNRVMYKEDPRIYFSKFATNPDSTDYSFGVKPVGLLTDTAYLTFRIMGTAVDKDREIKVTIADSSKAKAGYHYNLGPLVMPANAYEVRVPVYLYRKPGLKDSIVTIDFTIEESKDFKPGYNDKPGLNVYDRLHYKISLNDQLLKPASWDSRLALSFGVYSKTKFNFMIVTTGKTDWNSTIFPGDQNFLIQTVKLSLYNYEQANGPMLDENGVRVVFP
ncbi:DUF4843 domain-containing protein [Chitinophaga sp. SYP-B3965]|uniref:DUF4843 domain-containing protein n=1 Tax=Chitinophaga sp. SYP-B3965 TaxID=2663120 RepID=UPI001299734B|nr:DUF4843 domain-containing protein [Chitinophaga sp. SYP-B3965]MRG47390.1 DUF4843 domain-containing protein [Chitinophaga sp. SYP-B3965]